jgi:divalent metal cation (Fe/Co/Zn/Cd) transporter
VESTVKKVGMVTVGVILVLAGVTFGLQGLGVIGGSAMSGKDMWAVIGPLIAVVGVILVVAGRRGSARVTAGSASRPEGDHSSGSGAAR